MLTVKSDRGVALIGLLCFLPFLFLSYLFFRIHETVCSFILIAIPMFLYCRFLVAVCRIFQFDNTGITISFLQIKKHYLWTELTLQQETLVNHMSFGKPQYKNCFFFNTARINKPRLVQPLLYCILIHPFCFVFVNSELLYDAPEVYPINRELFLEKYSEWQKNSSISLPEQTENY